MSQENVELTYRATDAFNRRDLDAFLAFMDPDVEFTTLILGLEGGSSYRGHEGVRRWWEKLFSVFPDFSSEIEEVRDLGDVTIMRVRQRGQGMESDAPTDQTAWLVTEVGANKTAVRWGVFRGEAEALEAAGLREWAMSQENVEIVRRYMEEPPAEVVPLEGVVDWIGGFWESDGDYYPVRKFPEARPCHGREEIARFFTEYRAACHYRFLVKDVRAIGDDRVLVHGRISAEGTASGVALEGDIYHCFWLRHGRFIRVEDHLTAKGALNALGLKGETLEAVGLRE